MRRFLLGACITAVMAVAAVACGGDAAPNTQGTAAGQTAAEARGERLSRTQGCAGCHGTNFEGGAGPGWIGLAGSEVVLADGTVVVADDEYLRVAIADPNAQLREGYTLRMPANNLTDAEIDDIVAYINSLADG